MLPYGGTILASTLTADQTGTLTVDVLASSSYATTPTVSITGGNPPTLSSASASQDTGLVNWTRTLAAGTRRHGAEPPL